MGIKIEFECPRWVATAVRYGLCVAVLATAGIALANVPNTFTTGETLKAADLNANFTAVNVVSASAERTGHIAPNTATWTTIPGMSVSITLAHSAQVQSTASGTQRTLDQLATTKCHVGYRYVIDGVPKGDPSWGQRINVSNGQASWHSDWSVNDSVTLAAGQHTIAVQAVNPTGGGDCYVCAEVDGSLTPYDTCVLNVVAIPQ